MMNEKFCEVIVVSLHLRCLVIIVMVIVIILSPGGTIRGTIAPPSSTPGNQIKLNRSHENRKNGK